MANAKEIALSTIDNPWSPFTEYDQWLQFDLTHGYNSDAYLARVADMESCRTEEDADAEYERAIDEIVKYNPLGVYIKVSNVNKETEENENNGSILHKRKRFKIEKVNDSVSISEKIHKALAKGTVEEE